MRTTKRFLQFHKGVVKWAKFFYLHDWDISCYHKQDKDNTEARATTVSSNQEKDAQVCYSTKIPKQYDSKFFAKKDAFHEACEVLLSELDELAREKTATGEQIDQARHTIINRLEKAIFYKQYK